MKSRSRTISSLKDAWETVMERPYRRAIVATVDYEQFILDMTHFSIGFPVDYLKTFKFFRCRDTHKLQALTYIADHRDAAFSRLQP